MSKDEFYRNPFLQEVFDSTGMAMGFDRVISTGRVTKEVRGDEGLDGIDPNLIAYYRGVIERECALELEERRGLHATLRQMMEGDNFDIYNLDFSQLEDLAEADPINMFKDCIGAMQKSEKQQGIDRFMSLVLSALFLTGSDELEGELIQVLRRKPGFKEACGRLLRNTSRCNWVVRCRDAISGGGYQFKNLMEFCGPTENEKGLTW